MLNKEHCTPKPGKELAQIGARATIDRSIYLFSWQNMGALNFQLNLLVNAEAVMPFPYVGLSSETNRLIFISEEGVLITDPEDVVFFEPDYISTSRSFAFDLGSFDVLIRNYIGPLNYNIITRFNEEKHITLTYHSPTNEGPKDYDIFTGYPDARARVLVEEVFVLMESIKSLVFRE